jgi:hypothetical protein
MKSRTPRRSELKGVVKRLKGKLTNRADLKKEGEEEMMGRKRAKGQHSKARLNPDPHRRG